MIRAAVLRLGGLPEEEISSLSALRDALAGLPKLMDREKALLSRGARHYVKATRWGAFWSASFRNGGPWTMSGFTAEMTTEWSEREVARSRTARSVWRYMLGGSPAARSLSIRQVESIFESFLLDARFDVPFVGA